MLDYDGTLAPFRREREKAIPYPGIRDILEEIMASGNSRVVIISGRAVADLIPLLGLKRMPEIWGSHGWEHRGRDGSYNLSPASESHLKGLADADFLIEKMKLGDYREEKPRSVALHWRGIPEREVDAVREFARAELNPIAGSYGLHLKYFDGGLELCAPGRNKGDVVRSIIEESPADSFFTYLGDDLTDEDAFEAIADRGLGVLVSPEKRPTKAKLHLIPPDELLEFLNEWNQVTKNGVCRD
jgi:trehalose 6-phosphate phosphatase